MTAESDAIELRAIELYMRRNPDATDLDYAKADFAQACRELAAKS